MYFTHTEMTVKKYSMDQVVSQALAVIKDKGRVLDARHVPQGTSKEATLTLNEFDSKIEKLIRLSVTAPYTPR